MVLAFSDEGGKIRIASMLINGYGANWEVRLFVNNITPDHATVDADYTEASFPGYSTQALSGLSYSGFDGSDNAVIDGGSYVFTRGIGAGTQTVYGFYIYDTDLGEAIAGERNPSGGVVISIPTQTYTVNLNLYVNNNPAP